MVVSSTRVVVEDDAVVSTFVEVATAVVTVDEVLVVVTPEPAAVQPATTKTPRARLDLITTDRIVRVESAARVEHRHGMHSRRAPVVCQLLGELAPDNATRNEVGVEVDVVAGRILTDVLDQLLVGLDTDAVVR